MKWKTDQIRQTDCFKVYLIFKVFKLFRTLNFLKLLFISTLACEAFESSLKFFTSREYFSSEMCLWLFFSWKWKTSRMAILAIVCYIKLTLHALNNELKINLVFSSIFLYFHIDKLIFIGSHAMEYFEDICDNSYTSWKAWLYVIDIGTLYCLLTREIILTLCEIVKQLFHITFHR